jgi:hypothetical protein
MIKPALAQSIPQPSVPEFSLKYSDTFTNIPATTTSTTNPYNGKTTTTTIPEQHIENKAINITIENQPFPSTVNGYTANLYYIVQTKPHFGNNSDWEQESYYYFPINTTSAISGALPADSGFYLPTQSSTNTTTIQYPANYNVGDQVDFQVKAVLGYYYTTPINIGGQSIQIYVNETLFAYQTSDWSPTQTFTMPNTISEFPTLIILPLLLSLFSVAVIVRHRKTANLNQ